MVKIPIRHVSRILGPTAVAVALVMLPSVSAAAPPRPTDEDKFDLASVTQRLVDMGYPGAIATRTGPDGTRQSVAAGTADLETGHPVPLEAEVRIGSATKTFTAIVVLQLVQEGLLRLEDTVESILPGVVRGDGVDASAITVRQLLQHTSGLPEYANLVAADPFAVRNIYRPPRDMLDIALDTPASFPAGQSYQYSNTGYLVLGLIIERISLRPIAEQIAERIVTPLGLVHTYLPAPGDRTFRGVNVNGYHVSADGELQDITEADPSWTWAAGAMISTPAELNVFMRAVLTGKLLDEALLAEMLTGIPTGQDLLPGSAYGLGIESIELPCGRAWGHSGDIPGFQTRNAVTADGTAFTVTLTALPWAIFDGTEDELLGHYQAVISVLGEVLCA